MEVQTAIKSNCSLADYQHCPAGFFSTRICMDKVNVSVTDYCGSLLSQGKLCPLPSNGLEIDQCYSE